MVSLTFLWFGSISTVFLPLFIDFCYSERFPLFCEVFLRFRPSVTMTSRAFSAALLTKILRCRCCLLPLPLTTAAAAARHLFESFRPRRRRRGISSNNDNGDATTKATTSPTTTTISTRATHIQRQHHHQQYHRWSALLSNK